MRSYCGLQLVQYVQVESQKQIYWTPHMLFFILIPYAQPRHSRSVFWPTEQGKKNQNKKPHTIQNGPVTGASSCLQG